MYKLINFLQKNILLFHWIDRIVANPLSFWFFRKNIFQVIKTSF
jgi:hypothetical protein